MSAVETIYIYTVSNFAIRSEKQILSYNKPYFSLRN